MNKSPFCVCYLHICYNGKYKKVYYYTNIFPETTEVYQGSSLKYTTRHLSNYNHYITIYKCIVKSEKDSVIYPAHFNNVDTMLRSHIEKKRL